MKNVQRLGATLFLTCCALRQSSLRLGLQSGHGSKEKDQHADGHERERGAREELRYSIETLAASGLHECDQGQDKSDAVTGQRDRGGGLWGPARCGTRKRTAQEAEPQEEKRREPEFAQMIHAPPA